MKTFSYLVIGILFGIVMTKSEAISWYRIQEMFRFDSIHMYGIIGVAVTCGVIFHQLIKRKEIADIFGAPIEIPPKPDTYVASIAGGTLFGLGWALTGACPGPLYVLLGNGYISVLVVLLSAVFGTLLYGVVKKSLPH